MESTDAVENGAVEITPNLTHCNVIISCPSGEIITIPTVYCNELLSTLKLALVDYVEICYYSNYNFAYLTPLSATDNDPTNTNYQNCVLNDYTEVGQVVLESLNNNCASTKTSANHEYVELYLKIVNESYDVKKARMQVKRARDILLNPPTQIGNKDQAIYLFNESTNTTKSTSKTTSAAATATTSKTTNTPTDISTTAAALEADQVEFPTLEEIFGTGDVNLGTFYQETLHRLGSGGAVKQGSAQGSEVTASSAVASTLSQWVKSVSLSEFNPPPPTRQMQGDLVYIEVGSFRCT